MTICGDHGMCHAYKHICEVGAGDKITKCQQVHVSWEVKVVKLGLSGCAMNGSERCLTLQKNGMVRVYWDTKGKSACFEMCTMDVVAPSDPFLGKIHTRL